MVFVALRFWSGDLRRVLVVKESWVKIQLIGVGVVLGVHPNRISHKKAKLV